MIDTNRSIYSLLNEEAKTWWYHRTLRTQGNIAEARRRERQTIKNSVQHIKDALACRGDLTIRNHGYTLQMGDSVLSGYGNLFNDVFIVACYKAGIKIIDQRDSFERTGSLKTCKWERKEQKANV